MEGLGNDFIVVKGPIDIQPNQVKSYCDRSSGIGADGFIVVSSIDDKSARMRYWNSDGSSAEMCGNGLRCVALFVVENSLVKPGAFVIKTDAGDLKVVWDGKNPNKIEAQVGKVTVSKKVLGLYGLDFYSANAGNPHAVTFVEDLDITPIKDIGAKVETNENFPNKTNVEFVQIISENQIKIICCGVVHLDCIL